MVFSKQIAGSNANIANMRQFCSVMGQIKWVIMPVLFKTEVFSIAYRKHKCKMTEVKTL